MPCQHRRSRSAGIRTAMSDPISNRDPTTPWRTYLMIEETILILGIYLALSVSKPLKNLLFGLCAPPSQPLLQLFHARGLDKHVNALKVRLPAGSATLNIDVQDADLAVFPNLLNGGLAGAINISVHISMLEKLPLVNFFLHCLHVCEVIVHTVLLTRPGCSSSVADTEPKGGLELFFELLDQSALADTRGPGHNKCLCCYHV
mmetsp:Transcript_34014/g.53005  ORF Transcript_34014/g.53005 Transcript_34014/m.53005 type:complete len:203 (-) Transcript_34014:164-772(-)